MPSKKIIISLDPTTAAAVESGAKVHGVTPSTWCYHAVRSIALGVPFQPEPRPTGLGAASDATRAAVWDAATKGRRKAKRKQRKGK